MQVERMKHRCGRTLEGKVRKESMVNSQTKVGRAITAGNPGQNRELEKGPSVDKKGHSTHGDTAPKKRTMDLERLLQEQWECRDPDTR